MARGQDNQTADDTQNTDNTAAAAAPAEAAAAAPAPAAAQGGDTRFIQITIDQTAVDLLNPAGVSVAGEVPAASYTAGQVLTRKEYVLRRWSQGADRGPISKELTRLQGKNVPYQIVFQATGGKNGVPGGPVKAATPPAPAPDAAPAAE